MTFVTEPVCFQTIEWYFNSHLVATTAHFRRNNTLVKFGTELVPVCKMFHEHYNFENLNTPLNWPLTIIGSSKDNLDRQHVFVDNPQSEVENFLGRRRVVYSLSKRTNYLVLTATLEINQVPTIIYYLWAREQ